MHQRTDLANGHITPTDRLAVELIQAADTPPFVAIAWPAKPTMCKPSDYPAAAAAIVRLISESATALANFKARRLL